MASASPSLDEVEELRLPAALELAFERQPAAQSYFLALSRTAKRNLLLGLAPAKRPATRQPRVAARLASASQRGQPAPGLLA